MCGGQTIPCLDRCLAHELDPDQNGDCLPQNPLRDYLIVLDVRSDINQNPSLASCWVLVLETGCCPVLTWSST